MPTGHFPYLISLPLVVNAGVSVLVGRDAHRLGQNGTLWSIASFLTFPLGVLAWLIVRATGRPAGIPPRPGA